MHFYKNVYGFAGSGCSYLGNGAMTELGPFFVKSDGKSLYKNVNTWNNCKSSHIFFLDINIISCWFKWRLLITITNMLFLESPAGADFFYSNTTLDYYKNCDKRIASDSYTFLINWLERFPQYKNIDFFFTGELCWTLYPTAHQSYS